jgi:hypothetical protein
LLADIERRARSRGASTLTSNRILDRLAENRATGAYMAAAALLTRISTGPPTAAAASGTMRCRSISSARSATTMATNVP